MEPANDFSLDYVIDETDKQYRNNFELLIIESKLKAHKCQYRCYENIKNLNDAEKCARKCFMPILYIKKNVSNLIENFKEEFEKCRTIGRSNYKDNKSLRNELTKCVETYKKNLDGAKEEIEYIYNGYMKNFDDLLNNDKMV